jgi:hypothetical protein
MNEQVWSFIRWTKRFTREELFVTTGCERANANHLIAALKMAGYIKVTATERTPAGQRRPVYELVRDTGVKPPRLVRSLYDPNTGEIFTPDLEPQAPGLPESRRRPRKCGSRS